MWSYLEEFWTAVQGVSLSAWEYTTDFFNSIGNAVAGAIGNLFYFVLHYINDLFVFFGWVGTILKEIIVLFLMPLTYVFTFLKTFLNSAFVTPNNFSFEWNSEILSIFSTIPYWSFVTSVLTIGVSIIVLFFVLKVFLRV